MTGHVHATAAAGFARAGAEYERGRPGYPPEAISHLTQTLGIAPGARVLDLAAGTGKLTRALSEQTFGHVVMGDLDTLLARVASVSYISALADADRSRVLDAVAEVVAHDPETAGREQIAMPYTTHVVSCHGRGAAN